MCSFQSQGFLQSLSKFRNSTEKLVDYLKIQLIHQNSGRSAYNSSVTIVVHRSNTGTSSGYPYASAPLPLTLRLRTGEQRLPLWEILTIL